MTGEPLKADWIISRPDATITALCAARAPEMIMRYVQARVRWSEADAALRALIALRDALPLSPEQAAQEEWFFAPPEGRVVEPMSPAVTGPLEAALAEARGMMTVTYEALTVVAYEVMHLLISRLGADHPSCWHLDDRGDAAVG